MAILLPSGQLYAAAESAALDNGGAALRPAPSGNEGGRPEPKPVPAPETLSSVSVSRADGSLTAAWPAVEHATSYHITYSSDGGASWSLAALNHPDASITVTGLDNTSDLHRRRPRPQRQRRQQLAQLRPRRALRPAHAGSHAGAYRDAHANAGTYRDTHADAGTYRNAHADAGTYRDAHADAGTYRDAHADARSHRDAHGHAGAYRDAYPNAGAGPGQDPVLRQQRQRPVLH